MGFERFYKVMINYGGFVVVNVWALRATDPKDLHTRRQAFEAANILHVRETVKGRTVVVAWGANIYNGLALRAVLIALERARGVFCLGSTKHGHPRHPLMLRQNTPLVEWFNVYA